MIVHDSIVFLNYIPAFTFAVAATASATKKNKQTRVECYDAWASGVYKQPPPSPRCNPHSLIRSSSPLSFPSSLSICAGVLFIPTTRLPLNPSSRTLLHTSAHLAHNHGLLLLHPLPSIHPLRRSEFLCSARALVECPSRLRRSEQEQLYVLRRRLKLCEGELWALVHGLLPSNRVCLICRRSC